MDNNYNTIENDEVNKSKKMTPVEFNKYFEDVMNKRPKQNLDLKKFIVDPQKRINELTILEILSGIKQTWFGITNDLLQSHINLDTFTKENRLFYLGLTLIIFILIVIVIKY
jgi:hypothetical protein